MTPVELFESFLIREVAAEDWVNTVVKSMSTSHVVEWDSLSDFAERDSLCGYDGDIDKPVHCYKRGNL